jgi:hypothetical protein
MTGAVARVNDAARAVPALAGQLETAVLFAVEVHVEFIEQQLANRNGPFRHQLPDGRRIGGAVTGFQDVPGQQLRVG